MSKKYTSFNLFLAFVFLSLLITSCSQKEQVSNQETFQETEIDTELLRVNPGECPSSCSVNWRNRKISQTVCAASNVDAETKANARARVSEASKNAVRTSCGLDCSSRSGCAAPSTCKEKWDNSSITGLGNGWTCTDTTEACDEGGTKWTCSRYYNLKLRLKCKCER